MSEFKNPYSMYFEKCFKNQEQCLKKKCLYTFTCVNKKKMTTTKLVVLNFGWTLESPRDFQKATMTRTHPKSIVSESLGMGSRHD